MKDIRKTPEYVDELEVGLARANARIKKLESQLAALQEANKATERTIDAANSALISMVYQYCSRTDKGHENTFSHDFMSAGEEAFEYLVEHGLATHCENTVDIWFPQPMTQDELPEPPEVKP